MNNTLEKEDNDNDDSNEADSESFVSQSDKENAGGDKKKDKRHVGKKPSNWDATTKKYKADFEIVNAEENESKNDETIEKKAVEKSPKERFVRVNNSLTIKV